MDVFARVFGFAWMGLFVAAYLAAAFYYGHWWGFLALVFPALVALGAARHY